MFPDDDQPHTIIGQGEWPDVRYPADERRDESTRTLVILGICAFLCALFVLGVYTFNVTM